MSTRYKIHNQNDSYFLTLTTVGWIDVFTRKEYKDILVESLKYCIENKGLIIYGFVIMSNHLHLMASATEPNQMSDILRDFKKFTARNIINEIRNSGKESRKEWMERLLKHYAKLSTGKKEFSLWQSDNHPKVLFSPDFIRQKLNYIHMNPVEEGIVGFPEHYLHSSASNYLSGKGLLEITIIEPMNNVGYIHVHKS